MPLPAAVALATLWLTSCAKATASCTAGLHSEDPGFDASGRDMCRNGRTIAWIQIGVVVVVLCVVAWLFRRWWRRIEHDPRPTDVGVVWKPLAVLAALVAAVSLAGNVWVWAHHRHDQRTRRHERCEGEIEGRVDQSIRDAPAYGHYPYTRAEYQKDERRCQRQDG